MGNGHAAGDGHDRTVARRRRFRLVGFGRTQEILCDATGAVPPSADELRELLLPDGALGAVLRRRLVRLGEARGWDLPPSCAEDGVWRPLAAAGTDAALDLADMALHDARFRHEFRWWTDEQALAVVPALWDALELLHRADGWVARVAPDRADRERAEAALRDLAAYRRLPQPPDGAVPDGPVWAAAYQWLLSKGYRARGVVAPDGDGGDPPAVVLRTDGPDGPCDVKLFVRAPAADAELETLRALDASAAHEPDAGAARAELARVHRCRAVLRLDASPPLSLVALVLDRAVADLGTYAQDLATTGLTCAVRLGLLADVCLGLRALHRAGRVACDLKPAGVLVFADGTARVAGLERDAERSSAGAVGCRGTGCFRLGAGERADDPRPRTFARDWLAFARLCLWLFAEQGTPPEAVACGAIDAAPGTLGPAVAAGWRVPTGRWDGGRCAPWPAAHRRAAAAPLAAACRPDADARALLDWAAAFAERPRVDAATDLFAGDAAFPPGLAAAAEARLGTA